MTWLLLNAVARASGGEEAVSFDPITFFLLASWEVKLVMIVLVLMFLGSVVIFVERLIAFLRSRGHSVRVAIATARAFREYDLDGAYNTAQKADFSAGHLTAVLRAGLAELKENPTHQGIENAERAIEKQTSEQLAKLKQWFGILATVASTAPFVGLAGTTRGVISAFTAMGTDGAGLSSISIGISEALWTTFFGIVVAILGVWFFNFFNGRLEKVAEELATAKLDIMNWANKFVERGGLPSVPALSSVPSEASGEAAPAPGK